MKREYQRPIANPTTWDLYMRAASLSRQLSDRERLLETRRLQQRAIELDYLRYLRYGQASKNWRASGKSACTETDDSVGPETEAEVARHQAVG